MQAAVIFSNGINARLSETSQNWHVIPLMGPGSNLLTQCNVQFNPALADVSTHLVSEVQLLHLSYLPSYEREITYTSQSLPFTIDSLDRSLDIYLNAITTREVHVGDQVM